MSHRILIIEDDADVARLLCARLRSVGFQPEAAADAMQGVTLAQRCPPDLVILDLAMPAGGGMSVIKRLRSLAKTSTLPIIVLTGSSDEAKKQEALSSGADAFVVKPYEVDSLLAEIRGRLCLA